MTPLEKKLDAIKNCIEIGAEEDAENHIFDLFNCIGQRTKKFMEGVSAACQPAIKFIN